MKDIDYCCSAVGTLANEGVNLAVQEAVFPITTRAFETLCPGSSEGSRGSRVETRVRGRVHSVWECARRSKLEQGNERKNEEESRVEVKRIASKVKEKQEKG